MEVNNLSPNASKPRKDVLERKSFLSTITQET